MLTQSSVAIAEVTAGAGVLRIGDWLV